MPEAVDKTVNEFQANWKGAAVYGLGTGLGSAYFGPLGHGAGALAAGMYEGGSTGDAMSTIGMGRSLAMILAAGGGGGGGQTQGVK